ncbi:glycosyltransferase family 2 protein [Pseudobutyrivibrio ruminis]|nr:glycosyltransferase [Pseudobutyrivibrio ruminis]
MPVYNTKDKYLVEAIESILNQTLKDIELIIVDDNSDAKTKNVIRSFLMDSRVKVIENDENLGVAASLNKGLGQVSGKYIARMDSDDVAFPNRLEKQYNYMEAHKDCVAIGSNMCLIDSQGQYIRYAKNYCEVNELKTAMFFGCSFFHPTMFLRRDIVLKEGYKYNCDYTTEDYELWNRIIYKYEMRNINEVLLKYRIHGNNVSTLKRELMDKSTARVQMERFKYYGVDISLNHDLICSCENIIELRRIESALKELIKKYEWIDKNVIKERVLMMYKNSSLKQLKLFGRYLRYFIVFRNNLI